MSVPKGERSVFRPLFSSLCPLHNKVRSYEKLDIKQRTLVWMYKFSDAVVQIVGQKAMEHAFSEEGELMCS